MKRKETRKKASKKGRTFVWPWSYEPKCASYSVTFLYLLLQSSQWNVLVTSSSSLRIASLRCSLSCVMVSSEMQVVLPGAHLAIEPLSFGLDLLALQQSAPRGLLHKLLVLFVPPDAG